MLEGQAFGKLPFQTIINPKNNVITITLESGKQVEDPTPTLKNVISK